MQDELTDIQKKRAAWVAEHPLKGLTLGEAFRLNEERLRLFPLTPEEQEERRNQKKITVEFVL